MSDLSRAIQIASDAHAGQLDRGGQPYILHPLRLMAQQKTDAERIVAVLHDVVEDCPRWTLERLTEEGFAAQIVDAIDRLSRREGESYDAFIDRCGGARLSAWIKLADLVDNCDIRRIPEPVEADFQRRDKYLRAISRLRLPV